jgi:hypothetical protein
MKKFSFPLGRVRDWRDTQARIEESKLESLYGELRAIDARVAAVVAARVESDETAIGASSVIGAELAAIDAFRRFSVAEHTRLDRLRIDCSRRIAQQIQVVTAKRRDLKLLDRLKQQRLAAWTVEFHRELEAEALESHLAKWNRDLHQRHLLK